MINNSNCEDNLGGMCPVCQQKMLVLEPQHYYCEQCKQEYQEQYVCPTCGQSTKVISGCGATHYLCRTDGLVSSHKIKHYYSAK